MRYTLTNYQDEDGPRRSVVAQTPDLVNMSQVNNLTDAIVKEVMTRIRMMWDWDAPMDRFYVPTVASFVTDFDFMDHSFGLYTPLNMVPKRDGADLYVMDFLFPTLSVKITPIVHQCISHYHLRQATVTVA